MPFDKNTDPNVQRKGGLNRWRGKDPLTVRNKSIRLSVSPKEYSMISDKAAAASLSNTEMIVRAVKNFEPDA